MECAIIRHGKRTTVRETSTRYLSYERDIESIKKYLKAHKNELYKIEVQKWAFDVAVVINFYPDA